VGTAGLIAKAACCSCLHCVLCCRDKLARVLMHASKLPEAFEALISCMNTLCQEVRISKLKPAMCSHHTRRFCQLQGGLGELLTGFPSSGPADQLLNSGPPTRWCRQCQGVLAPQVIHCHVV
jgi:hypothetical protein